MKRLKHLITMFGWSLNSWVHSLGLHRLPIFGPIWFAGKRLMAVWLASGRGVRTILGGEPVYVHPFTIVYSLDDWEPYTEELFQKAITPGSTVLDLGAHHGYFAMLASRHVGKEGNVYAFEPAPENFRIMKKNIELNDLKNVTAVNMAVSDKRGNVPFYLCKPNDVQGSLFATLRNNESAVSVESMTIDEFMDGKSVDVVKMDIEGGEPRALIGMEKTLQLSEDVTLFIEFNHQLLYRAEVDPTDLFSQLDEAGFECKVINEGLKALLPIVHPLTPEDLLSEGFQHGFCNLYCTRKPV